MERRPQGASRRADEIHKVEHHEALAFFLMPRFMWDMREHYYSVQARALEFCILTSTRSGAVLGARWDEFDFDAAIWNIPGDRTKSGRAYRVPLGKRALAILAALPRSGPYVFTGTRGRLGKDAMRLMLQSMGDDRNTVHGFRASFSTWANERTATPNEIIEMSLGHTIKGKVEAAYNRSDVVEKRRKLMEMWGEFCEQPADGQMQVVSIFGDKSA